MGAVLGLDVGLSTGLALLHGHLASTDTVKADDLQQYLRDLRDQLAQQGVALDSVIAEKPLTIFRSKLSRDLDALIGVVNTTFRDVRWVQPADWMQQKEPLRRYARSRHLLAWRLCRTPHEKDALLLALWHQGVLLPASARSGP